MNRAEMDAAIRAAWENDVREVDPDGRTIIRFDRIAFIAGMRVAAASLQSAAGLQTVRGAASYIRAAADELEQTK